MKLSLTVLMCFTFTAIATDIPDCPEGYKEDNGCATFAEKGYCKQDSVYYKYVTSTCPGSCGLCKAPPPPPPEIVNEDVEACLAAHNERRRLHVDTPDLSWDPTLAAEAGQWALKQATENTFHHSQNRWYGENMFKSGGLSNCQNAVKAWYGEIKDYDYSNPGWSGNTGHFTQVVWKSTTKVGVGVATATHNGRLITVVVARYTPAGNSGGYSSNVSPLKSG